MGESLLNPLQQLQSARRTISDSYRLINEINFHITDAESEIKRLRDKVKEMGAVVDRARAASSVSE